MRKYKKYVVGYDKDDECIYGDIPMDSGLSYIDPIGIREATKLQKEMIYDNDNYKHPKIVIYELVPIKIEDK